MLCINWLPQITCGMNVRLASRTEVSLGQRVIQEVQPPECVVWTGFCLANKPFYFLFSTAPLLCIIIISLFCFTFSFLVSVGIQQMIRKYGKILGNFETLACQKLKVVNLQYSRVNIIIFIFLSRSLHYKLNKK